ncbi:MAG: ISAs1 family transposase [Bacteroidales bacterium]
MENKGHGKERERLFTNSFSTLEDPRRTNKGYYSYPLIEILFLCISASLSGFSTWTDIALFGKEKLEWLRKFYLYINGTPSHDVLGKLFARLDTDSFNKCFISWINELTDLPDGAVVAIDGKSIKGSVIKGKTKALHIVSAYASEDKVTLAQIATKEKSNERSADATS